MEVLLFVGHSFIEIVFNDKLVKFFLNNLKIENINQVE